MKKIENFEVTVTYHASLCDIEVTDEIYEALINCTSSISTQDACMSPEESAAMDWLSTHVKESDANNWEYEIDDLTE